MKEIEKLDDQRKAINQQISALWTKLEGHGFDKKGLKAAHSRVKMDSDKENLFDHSMIFARNALGKPMPNTLLAGSINAAFLRKEQKDEEESA